MTNPPFRRQFKEPPRLTEAELAELFECARNPELPWEYTKSRLAVLSLIGLIEERDAIIHDLQQSEEAYQRGISDGRRECIEALNVLGDHYRRQSHQNYTRQGSNFDQRATALHAAADLLAREKDNHPPLPPDLVRAENVRLREELDRLKRALSAKSSQSVG